MKKVRYIKIQVDKRYKGRAYIKRYMHLLNIITPNKYRLDCINLLASIENSFTQQTIAIFSDNPFKL